METTGGNDTPSDDMAVNEIKHRLSMICDDLKLSVFTKLSVQSNYAEVQAVDKDVATTATTTTTTVTTSTTTSDSTVEVTTAIDDDMSKYMFNYVKLSDMTLLRFLRGRKGDIDKAVRALTKYLKWRHDNNADNIDISFIQREIDARKIVLGSRDNEGRPILCICVSRHNMADRDMKTMQSFIVYVLENVLKDSKPEEEKMTILFDLSNISLNCVDMEVVKMLINILQYNYPETLHLAIVLNAPFLFTAFWMMIKLLIDPVTSKKVVFANHQQLKSYVNIDDMPIDITLSNRSNTSTSTPKSSTSSLTELG